MTSECAARQATVPSGRSAIVSSSVWSTTWSSRAEARMATVGVRARVRPRAARRCVPRARRRGSRSAPRAVRRVDQDRVGLVEHVRGEARRPARSAGLRRAARRGISCPGSDRPACRSRSTCRRSRRCRRPLLPGRCPPSDSERRSRRGTGRRGAGPLRVTPRLARRSRPVRRMRRSGLRDRPRPWRRRRAAQSVVAERWRWARRWRWRACAAFRA